MSMRALCLSSVEKATERKTATGDTANDHDATAGVSKQPRKMTERVLEEASQENKEKDSLAQPAFSKCRAATDVQQSVPSSGAPVHIDNPASTPSIPGTNIPISRVHHYLNTELSVIDFDDFEQHLWMAGLDATRIRPLHRQKVVGRQLIVAEQMTLHLVTYRRSIFVKPIPGCLLDNCFFKQHILPKLSLRTPALAFLSTYLKLIRYNSDLGIAKELGLVPPGMSWEAWLMFARQLEPEIAKLQGTVPCRYRHGELRLERLNLIAQFLHGRFSRGFITLDTEYSTYFSPIFKGVIFWFAYTATYLAAFQVAMAAPSPPSAIMSVGLWLSIAVLIAMGGITAVLMLWFIFLTLDSLFFALNRHRRYVRKPRTNTLSI